MKNLQKPLFILLALLLLAGSDILAQTPEALKYQAVVRDASYAPINGQEVSIRFSIVEGDILGPIVYQEFHKPTTSEIGLVSLNVGEGTVLNGVFADIDWGNGDHFLQVELDEAGGSSYAILGISQLLSVPYALYAKEAETAKNVDDADADSTNELQNLILNGNELWITQGDTVTLPTLVGGEGISIENGVVNNLQPSLWQLDSNVVFVDSNVVGIGIPDSFEFPTDASLFVNGNVRIADDSALTGLGQMVGTSGIDFSADADKNAEMRLLSNGRVIFDEEVGINQVFSFIDFNIRNQAGNSTVFQVEAESGSDLFEIGRTGNVGINQITNNVTLQVQNRDTTGGVNNNIIANFERANGDNVLQIQDDRDVVVTGDFSVNSGNKNFILDHPLDPANKVLAHNAVESPDHVTYYHGTIELNADGEGVVTLPTYFEALNTDYHYQLTCIGGFAQVYIAKEITNNQFTIAGGHAGMKVSWMVSAKRDDPWAHDHPYEAEFDKEPWEQGLYYYPEGYGKGRESKIGSTDNTENGTER